MEQNTTSTKHGELLNTQSNVENNPNKNSTLIEQEKIEGTPFMAIKQNNQWFLTLGNYRLTEGTDTLEETEDKLKTEMWELIMKVSITVVDIRQRLTTITHTNSTNPVDENPTP